MDFTNITAVITGGNSGIGKATAAAMVGRGACVAVFDLNTDAVPTSMLGVTVDVSSDRSVGSGVHAVIEKLGGIDVVVNCAGLAGHGNVEANSDAEWMRIMDINVLGTVRMARHALKALRRSPAASIVNVGSVAAVVGMPDRAAYTASKGAVLSLTRSMAVDYLTEGIRVNCILPGTTDTPWIDRQISEAEDPAAARARFVARQPHSRLVTSEEVAEAIAYLASPLSGSTTGSSLIVDGGLTSLRGAVVS